MHNNWFEHQIYRCESSILQIVEIRIDIGLPSGWYVTLLLLIRMHNAKLDYANQRSYHLWLMSIVKHASGFSIKQGFQDFVLYIHPSWK